MALIGNREFSYFILLFNTYSAARGGGEQLTFLFEYPFHLLKGSFLIGGKPLTSFGDYSKYLILRRFWTFFLYLILIPPKAGNS
jgi:hypothetical protein